MRSRVMKSRNQARLQPRAASSQHPATPRTGGRRSSPQRRGDDRRVMPATSCDRLRLRLRLRLRSRLRRRLRRLAWWR
jgi:hypothetical protein